MSFLKKLASDTAIYGINSILGRLINFILVPLQTGAFEKPGDLAIIIKTYSIVTFLNVLYTYGMETAFFRFATSKTEDLRKVYNTSMSAIWLSSLVFSGLIIIFAPQIAIWLGGAEHSQLVVWFAFIIGLDAVVRIPFARLRLENKAKRYVAINFASIVLNVGLNFLFIYFAKRAYYGVDGSTAYSFLAGLYNPAIGSGYIVLANLLANLIYVPLLWPELVLKFTFKIDKVLLQKMWHYGYPILILGLAGMVNLQIDRTMLEAYLPTNFYEGLTSKDVLGIYGSCYKLSVFIMLATQSFRFAADPFFFSKAEDKNAPEVFAKVTLWFTIVCCIIWIGIGANMNVVGLWVAKPYRSGLGIVQFLMLGNIFLGIYYNVAVWFKITDRTKFGTYITLIGAVINVVLNYILIPQIGYMGCAWAFVISCMIMTAVCYFMGNRYFPVPYAIGKICSYLLLAGGLIYLAQGITIENIYLSLLARSVVLLPFLATVYLVEIKGMIKW